MTKTLNHPLNQPSPLFSSKSITSVGNCEQVHTSVFHLIFRQANVAGEGNCRNEDLKSAVVVGLPHNSLKSLLHWRWQNFWLTVQTGISDLDLVSLTLFHCGWVKRLFGTGTPWIPFLRIRCWRGRNWICKKNFPDMPCVSQMLGGPFLRLGIREERLSISPRIGWSGKDTGWLVTWECPLQIDSASWKSLESFIQLFSFCNSCILPVSSRIVSWSSNNLRLAIVSKVELWNFFKSSGSLGLLSWASRNSEFCCKNRSWRSCWSHRWSSPAWAQWSSFFLLRFNNFT